MDAPTPPPVAAAPPASGGGDGPPPPFPPAEPHPSVVVAAVLAHCGGLVGGGGGGGGSGAAIDAASIVAERVGVGLGYLSTIYAATFTVRPTGVSPPPPPPPSCPGAGQAAGGGGTPPPPTTTHTVIVKVAPSREGVPALLALGFHATEVAFLTRLAPAVASPLVPRCYGAAVDAPTDAGVVVMEDLRPRGGGVLPFDAGIPLGAAVAAAAALGRLHAAVDAALRRGEGGGGDGAPTAPTAAPTAAAPTIHPPAWADRPPAEAARRAAIVAGLFADAAAGLAATPGGWSPPLDAAEWVARPDSVAGCLPPPPPPSFATVTHGDAWSNNIFFRRGKAAGAGGGEGGRAPDADAAAVASADTPDATAAGSGSDADADADANAADGRDGWTVVGIVDWQVATWGPGVGDVAFLWLSSVDPAVRRAPGATAAILDAYAAAVGAAAPRGRAGLAADWAAALPAALVMCVVSADIFDGCRPRLVAAVEDVLAARGGEGPLLVD